MTHSFRIGATDAEHLAKEFYPIFNEDDLINLPRYSMYLKFMIDGSTSAFSAMTLPPYLKTDSHKEKVVEFSRKIYGRERELVEKSIFNWHPKPAEENKELGLLD